MGEDSLSPTGTPDIKDYLPSRRLGQIGVETWGAIGGGSVRMHAEFADTVCRYSVPDPDYDCAYEHHIYTDGYRYRGRVIGHALDGDGQSFSVGGTYVDDFGDPWSFTARSVEVNMAGLSHGNTVSSDRRKLYNLEFSHRREIKIGTVELGVGYDHITEGNADDRLRANLRFSVDLY